MAKGRITTRTGERLIRLAYDLEALSARLRRTGFDNEANSVQSAMKSVRAAGDSIMEKVR